VQYSCPGPTIDFIALVLGFLRSAPDSSLQELQRLSLFTNLSGRELKIVQGVLHEREYLAGEVLFDEGEEGNALYIVRSGRILICRQSHPELAIAEHEPGSFFGELALLDSAPRSAQARALERSRVAVLFGSDFLGLLETEARLANHILVPLARHLGHRLRTSVAVPDADRPT
jgi:CRP/FNR family cyclic AMP-dependent transcriptional regulator